MDLLSMLMNAKVKDVQGEDVGEVFGVHIAGGRLVVTVDVEVEYEEDPDGGEEEDIPEDDIGPLRLVEKTGSGDG